MKTNHLQNKTKNTTTNKHYKKRQEKTKLKQTAKSLVRDWIGCLAGDCRVNIGWAWECVCECVPVCTPLCLCLSESQQVASVHVWPEVVDRWPCCHLHTNTTHTQDYRSGRLHPSGWPLLQARRSTQTRRCCARGPADLRGTFHTRG